MRLLLASSSAIGLALCGAWAATAFIADIFGAQAALGKPLVTIGQTPIYPPWAIFAWTERFAEDFPRPFALARLMVGAGLVSAVCVLALALKGKANTKPFGQEAWGGFAEAQAAGLFAPLGTVLGKLKGETLCFDGPEHQLLIGASRAGKGRGHVVPTLLAWPRSVLVLDVKGELADGDARHGFAGTAGFRETLGSVLRFAPTKDTSAAFNPLFEVRRGTHEVRDVQNIVEIIVDPAGDRRNQDFWDRSAKQVLVGVILHVLYAEPLERKTLAVVREKLRDLGITADEMRRTLHRRNPLTGAPEVHPEVQHAAESYLSGEERLQSGVKATAESFFGLFADPMVARNTARSDFRIADLMAGERPVSLFLQPPPSDAARLMPLMRLIINQIARGLMEDQTHTADGREKRHRLLVCLDEFPQLGRMPFFETAMGAMAGYGLKAYLVCQSLNHITRAYGRDNVILDNCHVVTAFAAADMETAKRIAEMAGEVWEVRPQLSEQRPGALFGPGKGQVTYREERRPLLLAGDVRQLPRDEQLVFVAGAKPLRTKKLRFDQEPVFAQRLRRPTGPFVSEPRGHDWSEVASLGLLPKERKAPSRPAKPALAAPDQPDMFADSDAAPAAPTISQRALAGVTPPPVPLPVPPPVAPSLPPAPPAPRAARGTGL